MRAENAELASQDLDLGFEELEPAEIASRLH